ncbi:uncharacterized protein EDB91DRAFT_1086434 [Suillus paluster]|uniref:uncharacterized protein n=1 Tax=Suillus paluster TaxID=48578 RepID=UPI001B87D5FC|nr:uncharacterized protein EDB91DRAFT_1086434 [Suillus paluster]KAG1727356.1 hypothetical protein EDB91DRAFT_1086434 [Suillus paluster]
MQVMEPDLTVRQSEDAACDVILPFQSIAVFHKVHYGTVDNNGMLGVKANVRHALFHNVKDSVAEKENWIPEKCPCSPCQDSPDGNSPIKNSPIKRLVTDRWDAEIKWCEEARKAHLLEVQLAAHGLTGFSQIVTNITKRFFLMHGVRNSPLQHDDLSWSPAEISYTIVRPQSPGISYTITRSSSPRAVFIWWWTAADTCTTYCSPDDYQQQPYLFCQQQAAPQMNQGPYQHGSHMHDEQLQNLNTMVVKLVLVVAKLEESNQQTLLVNAQCSVADEALTSDVKTLTHQFQTMQTELSQLTMKSHKKSTGKDISNDHPALKALGAIKPLDSGEPYKRSKSTDKVIWHPNWMGQVDESVNAKFIKEVVECVYNDEKHCCESLHAKGEIPDEDFNMQVIMQCTKDYFRNIHKQVLSCSDVDKAKKAQEKKDQIHQWTRRQTATKNCRLAAVDWEKETGNTGAVAMIDTDYASNILLYDEGNLSEDKLSWRVKSGAGKGANMAIGLEWCSFDYVSFLHFLTLRSMRNPADNSKKTSLDTNNTTTLNQQTSECLNKRRRTTEGWDKKLIKKTFDLNPNQMINHTPKSAKGNLPFENMVADKWRQTHPDMKMLEGVEWLKGFWGRTDKEEFLEEDWDYLVELNKWHIKQDGASDSESIVAQTLVLSSPIETVVIPS